MRVALRPGPMTKRAAPTTPGSRRIIPGSGPTHPVGGEGVGPGRSQVSRQPDSLFTLSFTVTDDIIQPNEKESKMRGSKP
jgi:hypothetical protein